MLLVIAFKVILLSLLLLTVLVPVRMRMFAAFESVAAERSRPFSQHRAIGLLAPLARFLDGIVIPVAEGAQVRARKDLAAAVTLAAPLAVFAVLPFGGRYTIAGREIELVVAPVEWGIVWLVAALLLSTCGAVGLFGDSTARVRYCVASVSLTLAAGLALTASVMVFDSLDPLAIAIAQDDTMSTGGLFGSVFPDLHGLRLPAWGIFLQPVSLLLFCVCTLAIPHVAVLHRSGETRRALDGVERFLVETSEQLNALVIAWVIVALFLGGGALPFVSTSQIVASITPHFGHGFATIVCMGSHFVIFMVKLLIVTAALEPLRRRLESLPFERVLVACWRYAIPISFVNVFLTAQWLLGSGDLQ